MNKIVTLLIIFALSALAATICSNLYNDGNETDLSSAQIMHLDLDAERLYLSEKNYIQVVILKKNKTAGRATCPIAPFIISVGKRKISIFPACYFSDATKRYAEESIVKEYLLYKLFENMRDGEYHYKASLLTIETKNRKVIALARERKNDFRKRVGGKLPQMGENDAQLDVALKHLIIGN